LENRVSILVSKLWRRKDSDVATVFAEAGPQWLGQNPARKFKVLRSIFQEICRILLQAQKQIIVIE
jgi:hypothetical protein